MSGLSWERVNELAADGGDFLADMARQAKSGVCNLYRNYPEWTTAGFPVDTPASQFARGFYDNLCRDEPGGLPDTPKPPFAGGQCACVEYFVNYQTIDKRNGQVFTGTSTCRGPIKGFGMRIVQSGGLPAYQYYLSGGNETCPQEVNFGTFGADIYTNSVVSVSRVDGRPDNCGNPDSDWGGNQKGEPTQSEKSPSIVYVDRDGNSFTIPFGYFQISPEFNVSVDVGGVEFKIDLGGFEFSPKFGEDGQPTGNSPGRCQLDSDTKRDINDILDAVDRIEEDVKAAKECACEANDGVKEIDPPKVDEENAEEESEEKESGKESRNDIEAVKITLTQRPNRGTIQAGEGAPDWMAAGWFEWEIRGGGFLPREPIHFDNNLFVRPLGVPVVGYAFTLTNGARGRVTVYRRGQL